MWIENFWKFNGPVERMTITRVQQRVYFGLQLDPVGIQFGLGLGRERMFASLFVSLDQHGIGQFQGSIQYASPLFVLLKRNSNGNITSQSQQGGNVFSLLLQVS